MSDAFYDAPAPTTSGAKATTIKARPTLTFLINSMEGGGAERAMANLLRHLSGHLPKMKVDLVLLDDLPVVQDIPDWVNLVVLDGRGSMLRSARVLARYFLRARPQICVSYLARSNALNVILSKLIRHRAVISERVQTTSHLKSARASALYRYITWLTYPRAFRVIAVSEGVADDLVENFAVARDRTRVIGNPIDGAALAKAAQETPAIDLPPRYILAVGRMVVNKNFEMLLHGYAKARPEADLVILGDGPEREALERLVTTLGLDGRVHMPGFVKNPYPVMAGAEALVSCSNAEGFPNTIIEAMALATPVIATDCPSGPSVVLRGKALKGAPIESNARDGLLIRMGASDELAQALELFEDPDRRHQFAARAHARAQAFGVDAVVRDFLDVIETSTRT
ncbi:glycosyltransferase [Maritimibacter sp. DP1N21-5]|uniref:glycosyltransferase n=1 Tax=Maritimibacter sp. DP1N21-5 TaxID=2836867 RepID=UPI001C447DCB|nr:glycosyltransferase [Maritimibacter sp. DP1N21-5]MBV7410319.1 glycosyltransferase [Maritimibacter sp. DP1N21-5]